MLNSCGVYLDHHASHPLLPCVRKALAESLDWVGNPSSIHQYGQRLRAKIEDIREQLAEWVGLPDGRVIFTSGATEANNLALLGHDGVVLASAIEHPAVVECVDSKNFIPITSNGIVDLTALHEKLQALPPHTNILVSVMYANNETGIIQPIPQIAQMVHQRNGLLHVDAVQALGRTEIDMRLQGIDMLSVSGHKIGAPAGIGALIAPALLPITPHIRGGGQEKGMRGGTENLLGIIGLGSAIEWYQQNQTSYVQALEALDTQLHAGIAELPVQWLGYAEPRLAGCALLLSEGADAQSLLMQLDLAGVAVSSGSACSSGTVADSHVLRAMGISEQLRRSALRVSFGESTTHSDLETFLRVYQQSLQ